MRRFLSALALALLGAAPAAAQSITAEIDRVETTPREPLRLLVTVKGSQTALPVLPELPDFQVRAGGKSTQVDIVNGRASSGAAYNYFLIPQRTGTFTIGPVMVEIDGKAYRSRPFQVRVLKADRDRPGNDRDLFIQVAVSDRQPFVGEQVIYTWKFLYRVQIGEPRLDPQDFDGFLSEPLGETRQYETVVGGRRYGVIERRVALFPQRAGTLTVPGSKLTCQVAVRDQRRRRRSLMDDFFGRVRAEQRVVPGPPVALEVRPLPSPPADFSGLVGKFQIQAEASKRQLQVGESTTVQITVSGQGNVQSIAEPPLPDLSAFKIYDDKTSSRIDRDGLELKGSKVFPKALVPLSPGETMIPAIPLVYFDPAAGSYRTTRTTPIVLAVDPAEGQEDLRLTESLAPTTGKVAVRILADDILPLYRGLDGATESPPGPPLQAALTGALAAPPLLFVGLWWRRRRQLRYQEDGALRRRQEALRRARKSLANDDPSEVVRTYIGDKLGREGGALTAAEAAAGLRQAGLGGDLVDEVRSFLEGLEASRYGAAGGAAGGELRDPAKALIERLEGALRKTRSKP
ncbi:MAG: BatD family protein [Acidobacteriota bacterium]